MFPAILVFFLVLLSSNSAAEDPPKVPGLFRRYELDLEMNLPESYTGTLTMEVTMHRTTKQIELITSEKQNIISAQYALKKDKRDWVQLLVHVEPNGRKANFEMQGKDGEFYNSTVYVLKMQFEGNFTDAKEGFYRSKEPMTENDYYAITGFSGYHACHFFPHYPARRLNIDLTVHPQEGYEVVTVDGLVEHLKYEIPIGAFGLFIGKFKKVSAGTYNIFVSSGGGRPVPSSFLALETGLLIAANMNQFFVANRTKELYINCVILPNSEPHVVDSWGLVYYHGADLIDGSELSDLLLIDTPRIVHGHYIMRFPNARISSRAIFETLLFVAEKNIRQAMGLEWLLVHEDLRMGFFLVIQTGIVEFLKYKQISRIYGDQGTMDFQYIEHVLPFRWQRIYGFSSLYPLRHEKQHIYMTKFLGVLRMYHDFLAETEYRATTEDFDRFLHSIFANFRNGTIPREGIIEALAEHMNAKYFMPGFAAADIDKNINTVDFPIINVEWDSFIGEILLSQTGIAKSETSFWNLPILIEYYSKVFDTNNTLIDSVPKTVFHSISQQHETVPIGVGVYDWVIMNPGRSVIYHINYPATLWIRLIERLKLPNFGGIHYINRAQLIDDVMVLGIKNYISKPRMQFNLLKYLVHETELLPWTVASRHLKFLYQKIIYEPTSAVRFKEFAAGLVAPLFDRYGTQDGGASERNTVKKLRSIAIDLACLFGNEKCVEQVQKIIRTTVTSNPYQELEVNTRDAICCAALRVKSQAMEQLVVQHAFQPKDYVEESDFYAYCMSCATSTSLLPNLTHFLFSIKNNRLKDLSIQDRFLENTLYTATQMIDGYRQMNALSMTYSLFDDSFKRWMIFTANQNNYAANVNFTFYRTFAFLNEEPWMEHMQTVDGILENVDWFLRKFNENVITYLIGQKQKIPVGRED